MAEDGGPPAKKARVTREEFEKMSHEELLQKCREQEEQITSLLAKQSSENAEELVSLRESEEKLKQQQMDATRRENVLVMRLTTKEQEMQEYLTQINDFKQTVNPSSAQLRGMLLDPAINLMFQRMKREMELAKERMEQAQSDMAAWKFTPDSQTGKRLMNKCRNLLLENEELGRVISSGRTAKLEGEIALEKKFVEEMKKSQAETDDFLLEMDEDVEGMQSTIYLLQHQLKDAKEQLVQLQQENAQLRAASAQQQPISSSSTTPKYSSKHEQVERTDEAVLAATTATDAEAAMEEDDEEKEAVRTSEGLWRGDAEVPGAACVPCSPAPCAHSPSPPSHCQQHSTSNGPRSLNTSPVETAARAGGASARASHLPMDTDCNSEDGEDDAESIQRSKSSSANHRRSHPSSPPAASDNHVRTSNHVASAERRHHRTPSSEGALSFDGTDVSSDGWSPRGGGQSKHDEDSGTPASHYEGEDGEGDSGDETRTKMEAQKVTSEGGGLVRNGVAANDHYDSQGDDIDDI